MSDKEEPREPVPNVPEYPWWVFPLIAVVVFVCWFVKCNIEQVRPS